MVTLFKKAPKQDSIFGRPYAVLNLSKVGLRYFRLFINVSPVTREERISRLIEHPSVGFVLSAEGWFNLGVGLWARDNAEINDISSQIRGLLQGDEIVYQSELTSLYSFGVKSARQAPPMPIVDSTLTPVELSPLELDYLKLITLDSSLPQEELAQLLAVSPDELSRIDLRLREAGVIVGSQERVDYGGIYYKVFVDTSSAQGGVDAEEFLKRLWADPSCIYIERANGKYDLEFELVLDAKSDIKAYVAGWGDHQTAVLTKNLYTNLYPLSKTANLTEIQKTLKAQQGSSIDFRNSKLWYLNYRGTEAYLDIYKNKAYFEVMERGEIELFGDIGAHIRAAHPDETYAVIDIGSGNGMKGRAFIERLGEPQVKAYYPVDIQPIELAAALAAHAPGAYAKHPTLLAFEGLGARFPLKLLPGERQLYLLFGGTYGNFLPATINRYLLPTLGSSSSLCIAMPITEAHTDQEILASYANAQYEETAFGPLAQAGFVKEDFEENPAYPGLWVYLAMEERRVVSSFVLNIDKGISGRDFKKGTVFIMISSWKPTLEEFRAALQSDFVVQKIFANTKIAIALIESQK